MSVSDWFERLFRKEAVHFVYAPIPASRQDNPVPEVQVQAEKHYFRFWLSEMFLNDDRRLFREYVPVVHSTVRLQFGQKAAQELPYVAGPQDVGLGSTLGKGVQLDHALTNLLPFRGGMVALAAALVAYKQKDFFQGFMEVLHDVSGLLNVGQLSATLKVVDGAVDGIQSLLGAGEKDVHLLYYKGFGGENAAGGAPLQSGYTAVFRADARKFDPTQLWVKNRQLHYGPSMASAQPLVGYDYMLIRIEAAIARDDFLSFEQFGKLLKDAIREGLSDRAKGDAIIQTALVTAYDSPDLTNADRLRVAKALKQEYLAAVDPDGSDASTGASTTRTSSRSPVEIESAVPPIHLTRDPGRGGSPRGIPYFGVDDLSLVDEGSGELERLNARVLAFDPEEAAEMMDNLVDDDRDSSLGRFLDQV
jgi:hypothetical protein